jgi:large subunit ribosomal protein L21
MAQKFAIAMPTFSEIGERRLIMYAIIKTGGKQYKVQEKDVLEVEKLEAKVGEKVEFVPLLISDDAGVSVGAPEVSGKKVVAEVVEVGKGEKLNIFVYKKKNTHHKAQGHRQPYSKIKIISIGK